MMALNLKVCFNLYEKAKEENIPTDTEDSIEKDVVEPGYA